VVVPPPGSDLDITLTVVMNPDGPDGVASGRQLHWRWLADMKKHFEACRISIARFSIAQDVLEKLILKKENHLRELHEVAKRVTEFEDFPTCSPTDRLRAKGLVGDVRRIVDDKGALNAIPITSSTAANCSSTD
jgi:hypothetical protein